MRPFTFLHLYAASIQPPSAPISSGASLFVAAGAWGAHTLLLRVSLGRRFLMMKAISETRPEGNPEVAAALALKLGVADLAGAPEEADLLSLPALLALNKPRTIVESPKLLLAGREALRAAAPGSSSVRLAPSSLGRSYRFAFRDYINFEELSAMMARRGGFTLLGSSADGQLSIGEGRECALVDRFRLLYFLPITIEWEGALSAEADRIDWTNTRARLGWQRLGKTFERPPTAERLRQNPWLVRGSVAGGGDECGMVVLENRGMGRLVYTEEGELTPA